MKANELRIGIFIQDIDTKRKGYITKINGNKLTVKLENSTLIQHFEEFESIELTEEILLKCGFKKKSWFTNGVVIECIYYQKGNFIIYLLKKSFEVELISDSRQFNLFKNFKKELHILQNLYLLLENEELEINL